MEADRAEVPVLLRLPGRAMSFAKFCKLNAQADSCQSPNDEGGLLRKRLTEYTTYELHDVDTGGHCQFDALAHQVRVAASALYCDDDVTYSWLSLATVFAEPRASDLRTVPK